MALTWMTEPFTARAKNTVLATGVLSRLFSSHITHTPYTETVAMAMRKDSEPDMSLFFIPRSVRCRCLITEGCRGEGGMLRKQ
jgi:aspartate oxidase